MDEKQKQFEALRKKLAMEREERQYKELDKEIKQREERIKKPLEKAGKIGKKILSYKPQVKLRKTGEQAFKSVAKAYKPTKKLSATLLSYGAGFSNQGQVQRVQAGPGRPAGVMKHRSPFTGKPIPAPQFYKEMRAFRRLQAQQADKVQEIKQVQFAKQGVAPNQIQQAVQEKMRQQFLQQQMPSRQIQRPIQQIPQQFRPQVTSQAVRPIWRRYNMIREERDIFGNVKQINSGNDPRNFWQ